MLLVYGQPGRKGVVSMLTASRRSWRLPVLVLLTGLALAAGGIAWATIPGEGVIKACYVPSSGTMRVIQVGESCRKNEEALEWNVQGIQGIRGEKGDTGEKGDAGEKGAPGANGISGYEIVRLTVSFTEPLGGVAKARQVQVLCPTGKVALGAGGNGLFFNGGAFVTRASVNETSVFQFGTVGGATVTFAKYDGGFFNLNDELRGEAWATCAMVAP